MHRVERTRRSNRASRCEVLVLICATAWVLALAGRVDCGYVGLDRRMSLVASTDESLLARTRIDTITGPLGFHRHLSL